ncbi:MAG: MFS transporter [Nitrospirota bacterium]|nr:MFS transporter [Nitrospirota bacterium]
MDTPHAFSALRHRNFRLFWFGQLISLTGTWMHQAAQGWLVFKLTNSPFYLGLAGTAFSAPVLLFTLAGGVMADRHSKRKIMLAAHTALMFLSLALAILVATGMVTVWHVLVLAFLIGTVNALEIPARQSFLIEMVGKENLMNAIALNSSAFHSARMIGPAIAGFIMGPLGLAPCFFINAMSFTAIIVALLKMRFAPAAPRPSDGKGIVKELKEGLSYLFHHENASILLLSVGVISFFGFPYVSFLPVYARDILHTGEKGLGMLMGCAGAGAFLGSAGLALRGDSSRKGLLMAVAGTVFSIALLVFSISKTVWLSYLMIFFLGLGAINHIATANSILQLSVPDELRGRVMSAFATTFLGMAPLGNFTVGSLAHYLGTQTALMISAIFCLAGTMLVLIIRPRIFKL